MPVVQLLFRQVNPVTGAYDPVVAADARVLIAPVRRMDSTSGEVLPVATPALIGASVTLPPGTYRFTLSKFPDGQAGYLSGPDAEQIRAVPASGGPYQIDDLDEVSISGGVSLLPEWKVYIDAAIAGVSAGAPTGSGPGGVLQPVDLYAVTALGQALITAAGGDDDARKLAMRAVIGAVALELGTDSPDKALPGDWRPEIADIIGTGSAGRDLLASDDADALRDAIDAGTSNLELGITSDTARAGDNPFDWADIPDKPSVFPPDSHGHSQSDITGLTAALAALAGINTNASNLTTGTLSIERASAAGVDVIVKPPGGSWAAPPTARTDRTRWFIGEGPASTDMRASDVWDEVIL